LVSEAKKEVQFPNILGYETLVCDLHMHTVFSDGMVWPTVRVEEAWREDIDVIAITDHIEYQPKADDIPTNHNRGYELAHNYAKSKDIMMIHGTEITRDTPPGHFNAIFLEDVDPLDEEDFVLQLENAKEQGAFVFWNHQGWQGEERGSWRDIHTKIFNEQLFHGMEVCNGKTYYPTAHKWCVEKNLTMMGTSDIHSPSLLHESSPDEHRTLTLVFVKDRTADELKNALVSGRTVVWYQNQLIGKKEYLEAIFKEAIVMEKPYLEHQNGYWIQVKNNADVEMHLERIGTEGPRELTLPPRSTMQCKVTVDEGVDEVDLSYTVTNFLVAPETGLPVEFTVNLK
jgi:hypothetical protein